MERNAKKLKEQWPGKHFLEPWFKKRTLILDSIYEVAILWKFNFFKTIKYQPVCDFLKRKLVDLRPFWAKIYFFKSSFWTYITVTESSNNFWLWKISKKSKIGPTYCTVPIEENILVNPSLVPQQKMPRKFSSQKRKYALTSPSQLVIPVLTFITCNL